ncbi:substrate-binding periplasmic protein [Chitinimonas sp.]|uniref:substrate-binding periplasmic protein n=1 Tax=Chitinimonas sp. TaxID=1934313 RepID=UPI002F939111
MLRLGGWCGLWLLASSAAWAELPPLRTAAQEGSNPKFVVLPDKRVGGICIELLAALTKTDPQLRFSGQQQIYPLSRIERMLEMDELDLACALVQTPTRSSKFLVVQPPAYEAAYGFAIRRGDTARPASWEELIRLGDDNTVLLVAGSGVAEALRQRSDIRIDTSGRTPQQNLAKLINHRGRVFYYRLQSMRREVEHSKLGGQIEVLPYVVDTYAFHLMLSRRQPPEANTRLHNALLQLQANGELAAIINRWQP